MIPPRPPLVGPGHARQVATQAHIQRLHWGADPDHQLHVGDSDGHSLLTSSGGAVAGTGPDSIPAGSHVHGRPVPAAIDRGRLNYPVALNAAQDRTVQSRRVRGERP
jgi:hypothetical protein